MQRSLTPGSGRPREGVTQRQRQAGTRMHHTEAIGRAQAARSLWCRVKKINHSLEDNEEGGGEGWWWWC